MTAERHTAERPRVRRGANLVSGSQSHSAWDSLVASVGEGWMIHEFDSSGLETRGRVTSRPQLNGQSVSFGVIWDYSGRHSPDVFQAPRSALSLRVNSHSILMGTTDRIWRLVPSETGAPEH